MPKVRFTRAGAVEMEFDLETRDLRVGRATDNDIVLRDPEKTLSRHHAELRYDGTQWFYLDLNSANGSWVDGAQVTRLALDRDVTITLGDYELAFLRDGRPREETTPDADGTRLMAVGSAPEPRGGAGRGRARPRHGHPRGGRPRRHPPPTWPTPSRPRRRRPAGRHSAAC